MRPKENNPLEFPKGIDGWEKPGGSETPGPETVRDRWFWAEPAVWTERMLTALEEGVKGGRWYCLWDKVIKVENGRYHWNPVTANRASRAQ